MAKPPYPFAPSGTAECPRRVRKRTSSSVPKADASNAREWWFSSHYRPPQAGLKWEATADVAQDGFTACYAYEAALAFRSGGRTTQAPHCDRWASSTDLTSDKGGRICI